MFVDIAKALFWSKPLIDFKKPLAELDKAKDKGLIRPTFILPPMLNNGEKTNTYLSEEAGTMKDAIGVTNFGEKTASEEDVPQWVGITNPQSCAPVSAARRLHRRNKSVKNPLHDRRGLMEKDGH